MNSRTQENNKSQGESTSEDQGVTVDEYMAWVATFDNLDPVMRYLVVKKSGPRLIDGGSAQLKKAHGMILAEIQAECDGEELSEQIKNGYLRVYERNKPFFLFALIAVIVCLCVVTFKLARILSNVF